MSSSFAVVCACALHKPARGNVILFHNTMLHFILFTYAYVRLKNQGCCKYNCSFTGWNLLSLLKWSMLRTYMYLCCAAHASLLAVIYMIIIYVIFCTT